MFFLQVNCNFQVDKKKLVKLLNLDIMKNLYLLLSCVLTASVITAQPVLTEKSHSIIAGDAHDYLFTSNAEIGPAGPMTTWDFTGLEFTEKSLTSNMLNSSVTEKAHQIPDANAVIEEFGNHFYFRVNGNSIEQYGVVTKNSVIRYDNPILKLRFPLSFGDSYSGTFSGEIMNGKTSANTNGHYNVTADGYGTLRLPGDITIHNVLRLKTEQIRNAGKPNEHAIITYRWYQPEVRYPVFVVIQYRSGDRLTTSQTAVYAHATSNQATLKSENVSGRTSEPMIFPNPYKNFINVSFELADNSPVTIELYDASGKRINTVVNNLPFETGKHIHKIDLNENGLKAGAYYVRTKLGDEVFVKKIVAVK